MRLPKKGKVFGIFTLIAIPFAIIVLMDFSRPPSFEFTEAGDALVDLQWQKESREGMRVPVGGFIHTRKAESNLVFESTTLHMHGRSDIQIKKLDSDGIEVFSTRGQWVLEPDREVRSCTRAVCTTSTEPFETLYYTPGEVVEIRAGGDALVEFNNQTYDLQKGDRIIIDELTGSVQF